MKITNTGYFYLDSKDCEKHIVILLWLWPVSPSVFKLLHFTRDRISVWTCTADEILHMNNESGIFTRHS